MRYTICMKTQKTTASVDEYIDAIADAQKRADCKQIDHLFQKISKQKGIMWGPSIVGYGSFSYTRSDGKSYDFLSLGFSSRAKNITIYSLPGYNLDNDATLEKIGKCKAGKSCIYIDRLSDIHIGNLEKLLRENFDTINGTHIDYAEKRKSA